MRHPRGFLLLAVDDRRLQGHRGQPFLVSPGHDDRRKNAILAHVPRDCTPPCAPQWRFASSNLFVQVTISFADAILTEAALSFLGLGVPPPTPSWGSMLNDGRQYLDQTGWYSFTSGAAIFLAVLSLNLIGDGLRDALDPRRAGRRE
jgi:hypothetical protein